MIPTGTVIKVWFACKICRQSFRNVDNFLEHKKVVHFDEFQKLSCIVFEERDIADNSDYNVGDGSSLSPATVIKQEQFLSSDGQNLDLKPVIYNTKATAAKPEPNVCQIKNETAIKFPKQPYVLLKRLTSKEIQNYKCQTQAFIPHHLTVPYSESEVRPFKCPHTNCQKAFKARKNLVKHLISHTKNLSFKCSSANCGKALKTRMYLVQHLKFHTTGKPFKCSSTNCGKAFKSRNCLVQHLRIHTQGRPFKCLRTNCGKAFKTRQGLVLHLKTHTEEKRFKCHEPHCEKLFSTRNSLRSHLVTHIHKKKFKCQEANCGKAFKIKKQLHLHQTIHSDSRPCFHCPYPNCGKVFRSIKNVKVHCASRHSQDSSASGEILFEYKKCDRTDCLSNRYQRRLDNEPIKCPQPNCTREFKHESVLRTHLVSHSNVKPYKCPVPNCNKKFKTRQHVKVHVSTHTTNPAVNALKRQHK